MSPLFLNEKDKKEMRENVQISTSSMLSKTNITLKQAALCVVTITMICLPSFPLENFIIFRSLFKTELNIYDGVFCKNNKLLTKKKLHHRRLLGF